MASLASRGMLFRTCVSGLAQRRLLQSSPRLLAIPQGRDREEYIDAGGASKKLQQLEQWAQQTKESLSAATQRFRKAHDVYYGKDRDMENYPPIKQAASMPPVRLGCLPDSWFQAFYDKTGVTGPYLLALGIPTFLISKEYWVLDPEGVVLLLVVPFAIFFTKRWGPKLKEIGEAKVEQRNKELIEEPVLRAKEQGSSLISAVDKKIQDDSVVFEEAFKAKRENIDLQLEAEYRKRLSEVGKVVERRMAYHIELANTKRQFQRQHLINWVVDGVKKSITPQQEKEVIQQCVKELRSLSSKAQV